MATRLKPIIPLSEIISLWGLSLLDVACYAFDGSLTLSIVVVGVNVEIGETLEDDEDKYCPSPHGYRYLNGVQDIYGLDAWQIIQRKTRVISRFKASEERHYIDICDNSDIEVDASDLFVRRDEFVRFAREYSFPIRAMSHPAKSMRVLGFHHDMTGTTSGFMFSDESTTMAFPNPRERWFAKSWIGFLSGETRSPTRAQ